MKQHDSFDDYVMARGGGLLRLAWLLTRDEHLAEDVVQEVLAKSSRRWSRIERAGSPDAYVRRMVVNQVLSWRRRQQDIPTARLADRPLAGTHGAPSAWDRADVLRQAEATRYVGGPVPPQG